jgi:hypothetical protein
MAAVSLGPDGVKAGLQWSQASGVGGFDLLAQGFGFFLAQPQVIVHLDLVAAVKGQSAINIGQRKRVETARDFFRPHPPAPVLQQNVEGDTRLTYSDGPRVIDAQGRWIGVKFDGHEQPILGDCNGHFKNSTR